MILRPGLVAVKEVGLVKLASMCPFSKATIGFACAISLVLACTGAVYGCSCETSRFDLPELEMDEPRHSWVLFKGIPLLLQDTVMQNSTYAVYTYRVTHVYAGVLADTIKVFTPKSSEMCGFYDEIGSPSIITAYPKLGDYHTAREDCIKTVSRHSDPKKYAQWDSFLTSIFEGIDGTYRLEQPASYFSGGYIDTVYSAPLLSYTIRDGKLDGEWKLYTRAGKLLESGSYQNGARFGEWWRREEILDSDKVIVQTTLRVYQEGRIVKENIEKKYRYW